MNLNFIDFEYNNPAERHMGLVSCSVGTKHSQEDFWLCGDNPDTQKLRSYLCSRKGEIIVCFNAEAEARSFVALGLNPLEYQWIDLFLDCRQLQNKDTRYQYGRYIDTGTLGTPVIMESRGYRNLRIGQYIPQTELDKERAIFNALASKKGFTKKEVNPNLLNMLMMFCGLSDSEAIREYIVKRDTRNLILSRPNRDYTSEEKNKILSYGQSDTECLHELLKSTHVHLGRASRQTNDQIIQHRLWRGNVGACMAVVSSNGTPIRMNSLNSLTKNSEKIEIAAKLSLNEETGLPISQWSRKGRKGLDSSFHFDKLSIKKKVISDYIGTLPASVEWPITSTGLYSTESDELEKHKDSDFVLGKLYRTVKTISAMKYSKPNESGNSIVSENIGSDNILRCSLFPYGTQTGRNTPKARQYIYAQGAWIKAALINIPDGYALVETDYSSQEFFISAVLSGDRNMMEAYKTDIYISFGLAANQYPKDISKLPISEIKHHPDKDILAIRQKLKAVVLGLSYGSGAPTIAHKTGLPLIEVTILVNQFKAEYSRYYAWREKIWSTHCMGLTPLTLPYSGWYLGRDNDSKLSTCNQPVQGTGTTILHDSLMQLLLIPIWVINSLHDAVYYLVKKEVLEDTIETVERTMLNSADKILGVSGMRVESEVWHAGERVITPKGRADWELYRGYVCDDDDDDDKNK